MHRFMKENARASVFADRAYLSTRPGIGCAFVDILRHVHSSNLSLSFFALSLVSGNTVRKYGRQIQFAVSNFLVYPLERSQSLRSLCEYVIVTVEHGWLMIYSSSPVG
jgi:hypothetical protein